MEYRKRLNSFRIDLMSMGGSFLAPLIIMFLGSVYIWIIYRGYPSDMVLTYIKGNFGVFSFPFICIWIFSMFRDLVESEGKECLLSLPYHSFTFGLLRVLRMTCLYIFFFFVFFLSLVFILSEKRISLQYIDWYMPILSLLFFSSLSYFLIILTKNIIISYALFSVFCIAQYMTRGAFSASIYPFHWSFPRPYTSDFLVSTLLFVAACILFSIAQFIFLKREYLLK